MNYLMAVCCLALAAAVSGCAVTGAADTATAGQSSEQALRSRVQARWDAVIALDFDRVYEFATPAYRQAHDLAHFKNQYASQITRTRIEIYETMFDPGNVDAARVVVLLYFRAEGGSGGSFEGMSRVVETWVRQDGQWWYIEPR